MAEIPLMACATFITDDQRTDVHAPISHEKKSKVSVYSLSEFNSPAVKTATIVCGRILKRPGIRSGFSTLKLRNCDQIALFEIKYLEISIKSQ
jgi:hypothetical protein